MEIVRSFLKAVFSTFIIRQDLRFVNRMYNLYNYTSRAVQQKQRKVNRVQCDRGTGAHGVRKGGETALFEPDVVSRHIKKAQHIMLRVF